MAKELLSHTPAWCGGVFFLTQRRCWVVLTFSSFSTLKEQKHFVRIVFRCLVSVVLMGHIIIIIKSLMVVKIPIRSASVRHKVTVNVYEYCVFISCAVVVVFHSVMC